MKRLKRREKRREKREEKIEEEDGENPEIRCEAEESDLEEKQAFQAGSGAAAMGILSFQLYAIAYDIFEFNFCAAFAHLQDRKPLLQQAPEQDKAVADKCIRIMNELYKARKLQCTEDDLIQASSLLNNHWFKQMHACTCMHGSMDQFIQSYAPMTHALCLGAT